MTNVWEVLPNANRFLCLQQNDLRYFDGRFEGKPMADSWTAPPFDLLNKSKNVADFTSWQIGSRAFLISRRAKDVIYDLCCGDVEFLPFATIKRTELFAVNVLKKLPVIDWPACSQNSNITCGRISIINGLNDLPLLFKDTECSSTFASDALGQVALQHSFTGLQLADPRKNLSKMIARGQPINEFPGL